LITYCFTVNVIALFIVIYWTLLKITNALGENCDEPLTDRRVGTLETEKSSSGAFAGMFVAILVIAAFIMLFLYYRNRVAGLKNVIHAHVQYGADPLSLNQGKYIFLMIYKYK